MNLGPERKVIMAGKGGRRRGAVWDAGQVRSLRQHLGLSQQGLADELGTRQQTISEWETGQYRPRGASARLLSLVAERAGFEYEVGQGSEVEGRGSP
jgi:transcriptional regulator with XRE-family HTH domain